MTQARNQETLLAEAKAAHIIIRNALNLMTMDQKSEWGRQNDAAGLVECGSTRAHEREAAIAEAERAALSQPQSQAQGEAVACNKSGAYAQRTLVADAIIDAYKEHYDFPPQGESHMHDCIMEELDIRDAAPVAAQQGLSSERIKAIAEKFFHADDTELADVKAAIKEALWETSRAAPQIPVAGDGLSANVRTLLEQCRDFIDATKTPAYPAGVDLADAIDALLAAPAASPAPPVTYMTEDEARDWAWQHAKKDFGTNKLSIGENSSNMAFFVRGWTDRGQYECQRAPAAAAQPDERTALIAERDAAIISTHRQALCIQRCAAHIGPDTSATIDGLPLAVKRVAEERDAALAAQREGGAK